MWMRSKSTCTCNWKSPNTTWETVSCICTENMHKKTKALDSQNVFEQVFPGMSIKSVHISVRVFITGNCYAVLYVLCILYSNWVGAFIHFLCEILNNCSFSISIHDPENSGFLDHCFLLEKFQQVNEKFSEHWALNFTACNVTLLKFLSCKFLVNYKCLNSAHFHFFNVYKSQRLLFYAKCIK